MTPLARTFDPLDTGLHAGLRRQRRGKGRQLGMAALLLFFSAVIGVYWWLTDPHWVKAKAESELSNMLGWRVTVERASLSIFEGLRLHGVRVAVDEADKEQPDSTLFTAERIWVRVNLAALLQRRLVPTQVVAVKPEVHLVENVETGRWNFHRRIARLPRKTEVEEPRDGKRPQQVPELLLRAGLVQYQELRAGHLERKGGLAIDGQITPLPKEHLYKFDFESRSTDEPVGPRVRGLLDVQRKVVMAGMALADAAPGTGRPRLTGAQGLEPHEKLIRTILRDAGEEGRLGFPLMENFQFGDVIRVMLPAQVQEWWARHALDGRIKVPRFFYQWDQQAWQVEVEVDHVRLGIPPEELMGQREAARVRRARPGTPVAGLSGGTYAWQDTGLAGRWEQLEKFIQPQPIPLYNVSGRFVFTPDRITFNDVSGTLEGNRMLARGRIGGYSTDAAVELRLVAPDIKVPLWPRYVSLLPANMRKLWSELLPSGRGSLAVDLARQDLRLAQAQGAASPPVQLSVELAIKDGEFCFHEVPYPLRRATGRVRFSRDPRTGFERVDLEGIRGYGLAGTTNADKAVEIDGWISPLDKRNQVEITVRGKGVSIDREVRKSLPIEAREVLAHFDERDAAGRVTRPLTAHGDFEARVLRPLGRGHKTAVHVDLDVAGASGAFEAFPYPVRNAKARIEVRTSHVTIRDFIARDGNAVLKLDGLVSWGRGRGAEPDLYLQATGIPIDSAFLNAIPGGERQWLEKTGIGGVMNAAGRIFARGAHARTGRAIGAGSIQDLTNAAWRPQALALASDTPSPGDGWIRPDHPGIDFARAKASVGWDMTMNVTGGTVWKVGQTHAVTDASAQLRLTESKLEILSLKGRRDDAEVAGRGLISWPSGSPQMRLDFAGKNLALDETFRKLIPQAAQKAWDELRAAGRIDLAVKYESGDSPAIARASQKKDKSWYEVSITPREGSLWPKVVPWKLEKVKGQAVVTPGRIELRDLTASHGDATVKMNGVNLETSDGWSEWRIAVSGENITVDDEFRAAVPEGLADLIEAIKYQGKLAFSAPDFVYRSREIQSAVARRARKTKPPRPQRPGRPQLTHQPDPPDEETEVDFGATVKIQAGSMDLGLPFSDVDGLVQIDSASIRDGAVRSLRGKIYADTLKLAGRAAQKFEADVVKPAGKDLYQFANLKGRVAGGTLAGQVELLVPDDGTSRYGVKIDLRGCDIRQLAGEQGENIKGRVSASVRLEGDWENASNRFGGGDIEVEGSELYRIPVVLGLLQITNLAMPIKKPFNRASTRYVVEGNRLTFEWITLRAKDLLMQGEGWVDFGTKKVSLTFTTDNPNWPDLPLLEEMKRDLMQIHVRGTVQEPKVGATLMNTFSTTVDEVFKGRDEGKRK